MSWDQIENKWAAMARRVRADWTGAVQDVASQPMPKLENKKVALPIIGALTGIQPSEENAAAIE
jgi:hypothetical protein